MRETKKLSSYLICLVLLVLYSSQIIAGIDEGIAAYNSGDHATAYNEFLPVAESGDKKAQLLLGLMYDNGLGIKQDYDQAAKWYRRAAEQGQPRAQFNLGLMYESGEGIESDQKLAISWVRKSAEQGYAEAQDKLAQYYEKGEYLEQDLVKSHLWYSLAASQGARESIAPRNRVASKLSKVQLEESEEMYNAWQNVFQSVF